MDLKLGKYSREGNGKPLQYSYLGNPMDRGPMLLMAVHEVGDNLVTKQQQDTEAMQVSTNI